MKTLPCLFKKPLDAPFLFLLFLPLMFSCNKEKLTKPTQTGANTFSCKINDKVYVAKTDLFSPGITGALVGTASNYHFFVTSVMYNGSKSDYTINISVPPNVIEGTFNLSNADITHRVGGNDIKYPVTSGEITFTHIDYTQRITSGTFHFNAASMTTASDIISVTDGRFDLKN